jgi:hypothetical protein
MSMPDNRTIAEIADAYLTRRDPYKSAIVDGICGMLDYMDMFPEKTAETIGMVHLLLKLVHNHTFMTSGENLDPEHQKSRKVLAELSVRITDAEAKIDRQVAGFRDALNRLNTDPAEASRIDAIINEMDEENPEEVAE